MIDDTALSRDLTQAIRGVEGVAGIYAAKPLVEAAAEAIAVKLDLVEPDCLVDIDRADDFTTVSAHIATTAVIPTPDVLRAVGELVRDRLRETSMPSGEIAVNVRVRFIEDTGNRA